MTWQVVVLILGLVAILFVGMPIAFGKYERSKKTSIFERGE